METSRDFPEETRRNSEEGILQTSNNVEDGFQSAQEQLAELQLLARADLHSAPAYSPPSSVEITTLSLAMDVTDEICLDESESQRRPKVGKGGLSSFTAILAASRKMATSSLDDVGQSGAPLEQTRELLTVQILDQCPPSPKSAGKSLPTLNEKMEDEEVDDDDEEAPETASVVTIAPATSVLTDTGSSLSLCADEVPARKDQEPEELDSYDAGFEEMLEHLSRGKIDFLALTAEDLTLRKLKRVHAALSRARSSTPSMPYVRTLVSIDMLRLLFQRLGQRSVREAITRGMRQANQREDAAAALDQIAVLTSTNIAAVVLSARQELAQLSIDSNAQLARRTTAPAGRQALHSPPRSRASSSPCSSVSSSRCSTPRSPAADRRSILAKEGVHVLMQEKLVSFDHRGQATALPAFRVRGASASAADSAAKRRQRGLQYANEHVMHRTVNL
ncbi:unnamed protein product [Phytophthora fragariaefolia]|uniref:Unnamed protein product n=1 Tax=Phytophthora fragariaefolia TaxID=1490495 RepID=A0A9W6XCT1_9STRA|nr:unnamed protein product [Phytophthora fragariaefolia]